MNFLDEVPTVRRIETDREDLLALEIVGHATAADAENLFGLLEAAYALHPRIDVFVRIIDHEGVDWTAISPDTLKQGKADAARHIARCAAIGEPDWTANVRSRFGQELPVEVRHFDDADEGAAWRWLGARPT